MGRQPYKENLMSSVCNVCHGQVKQTTITYTQWIDGRVIVVENVPAWRCEQCGETYFDPQIVAKLQALIWSNAEPSQVIETPVYDLAQ
jgi:YgiT-type zinc finger domain-containing protein